jgi:hypothetical protein
MYSGHLDYTVFGSWSFDLYRQTRRKSQLKTAIQLADYELKNS